MNPTDELYSALSNSYTHFNDTLFGGQLPSVIITTQRQKSVMGYFAPDRWANKAGKNCHELAINPTYVGRSAPIELFQTMVHEQVHCWQHCFGNASRTGYHNKEWAEKMESIGLMPSTTGRPGGKKIGFKMNDYPIAGGRFLEECEALITSKAFDFPWIDRYSASSKAVYEIFDYEGEPASESVPEETLSLLLAPVATQEVDLVAPETLQLAAKKVKSKYACNSCGASVWGKPGLNISCNDCKLPMLDQALFLE